MTQHHDPVHPDDGDDVREPLPTLTDEDEAFLIGLLGGLPPVEMPADVAANLDAALARESAERAATGASEPAPGSATVVPLEPRRAQRRTRILQAAAAVVLVAAGGAVAVSVLNHGGGASSAGGNAANTPAAIPVADTGHTYTAQSLDADVQALAAGTLPTETPGGATETPKGPSASGETPTPSSPAPSPLSFSASALVACLAAVEGDQASGVAPVAMDRGVYNGQAVLVIVLPGLQDPAHNYSVFIVTAQCGQNAEDHTLTYGLVPKP